MTKYLGFYDDSEWDTQLTERANFWNFAHEVQIGNRVITAWRNNQACGFSIHFAIDGEEADTHVAISAFDISVFGKNGTYKTTDAHSFPSLRTAEGLYRLVNWLCAEGLL